MGKAQTPVGDVFRVETMTGNVDVFKTYRPAEGGLKISCNGDGCAEGLPICTAELAFPKGPMNDISTRSRPWTTAPVWRT